MIIVVLFSHRGMLLLRNVAAGFGAEMQVLLSGPKLQKTNCTDKRAWAGDVLEITNADRKSLAHVFTSVRSGHRRQNATFELQDRTLDSNEREFAFG